MRREGANMVDVAHKEMMENVELKLKWQASFDVESLLKDEQGLIEMIRKSVILRYINMGTAQYLRDFRRSYDLKKSAELRKRVLQRQQKNQEKTDSIPFKEILTDRTQGKSFSHERLTRFVQKYSDPSVLSRAYLRVNLVALCEAYGVGFRRNATKKDLASSLVEAIKVTVHPIHHYC
ncbi:hypothetical protein OS493_030471 [Desmophyllum pertusum]|uniref:Uncharacterized protein n=1 Tax=Desmophyllum pertusum TaxID=174260 RepID=A0A9W9YWG8_9CNID|nr:hypothetical protein OS493_030471 [Desmophyllum pertusum]